jgi:hypothetical protein
MRASSQSLKPFIDLRWGLLRFCVRAFFTAAPAPQMRAPHFRTCPCTAVRYRNIFVISLQL